MSVEELQAAVSSLPADKLAVFSAWFDECRANAWDDQITADLDTGRLDRLIGEVEKEYQAGLARPL